MADQRTPVQLAVALRSLATERALLIKLDERTLIEAATALERVAIDNGTALILPVSKARVEFPRVAQPVMSVAAFDLPAPSPECVVIDGLQPGEHRAVDLWGTFVVVWRLPHDRD